MLQALSPPPPHQKRSANILPAYVLFVTDVPGLHCLQTGCQGCKHNWLVQGPAGSFAEVTALARQIW